MFKYCLPALGLWFATTQVSPAQNLPWWPAEARQQTLAAPPSSPTLIQSTGLMRSSMTPNGCGTETGLLWGLGSPRVVPQGFGGADFRPACNQHDLCYGTLGVSRSFCDDQFSRDLMRSCTLPSVQNPLRCLEGAAIYSTGVRVFGRGSYREAQAEALRPPKGANLFAEQPHFTTRARLAEIPALPGTAAYKPQQLSGASLAKPPVGSAAKATVQCSSALQALGSGFGKKPKVKSTPLP